MIINRADWPRLSELLNQALDLTVEQQAAWLAQLVGPDQELSEPLRTLLSQRARIETRDGLDKPPDIARALLADTERRQAAAQDLTPGALAGAYRLIRELGAGGMGAVWLAERIDGKVKRHVALKFPYAGPFQRQLAERIVRERDILASLEHPNIARLYDADVTTAGSPFLVLEYVDGIPIQEYCDRQGLKIRERLDLFVQVLNAVQYAHARLVIHRDIKPSNILITEDGVAHLLDFGVAKLMPAGIANETELTSVTGRALTPDYASPEQITGDVVTTASDVYSLGVVLYELLTGTRPYRLKRDSRASLEDAIVEADVVVPSRVVDSAKGSAAKKLAAQLRGDLDAILLKALRKDVTARYSTAAAFREDIDRHLDGRPVLVQDVSTRYRVKKFLLRNWLATTAVATIVLALSIGLGVALWQAHLAKVERDRAFELANRNEAVNEFMDAVMVDAARAGAPITANDLLKRSEQLAERDFAGQPDHLATVLVMLAANYRSLDALEEARPLMERALTLAKASHDADMASSIECEVAFYAAREGNNDQAIAQLNEILSRKEISDRTAASCLQKLAHIAQTTDDGQHALDYALRALKLMQDSPNKSAVGEATLLGDVANGYRILGRVAEADLRFRQAVDKYSELKLDRSNKAIAIKNNWAILVSYSGDPRRAMELFRQILETATADDPQHPPLYLVGNYANALESVGRYAEAKSEYEQVLTLASAAHNDSMVVYSLVGLANIARESGELEDAERRLDEVDRMIGVTVPRGSAAANNAKIVRGRIALSRGRYADARAAFTDVLVGHEKVSTTPWILRARVGLAEGNLEAAMADAKSALDLARSQQKDMPYSNRAGLAWLTLGRILEKQNKADEAQDAFQKAVDNLQHTVDSKDPSLQEAIQLARTTAGPRTR